MEQIQIIDKKKKTSNDEFHKEYRQMLEGLTQALGEGFKGHFTLRRVSGVGYMTAWDYYQIRRGRIFPEVILRSETPTVRGRDDDNGEFIMTSIDPLDIRLFDRPTSDTVKSWLKNYLESSQYKSMIKMKIETYF